MGEEKIDDEDHDEDADYDNDDDDNDDVDDDMRIKFLVESWRCLSYYEGTKQ